MSREKYTFSTDTLGGMLLEMSARLPEADALVFPDNKRSFSQITSDAVQKARSLQALGVKPGDHVGILLPTCMDFPEVFFAVSMCGAIAVPVNTRNQYREIAYLVGNAELVCLFTTDIVEDHVHFADRVTKALPGLKDQQDTKALSLSDFPALKSLVYLGSSEAPGFLSEAEFDALAETSDEEQVYQSAAAVDPDSPGLMLYTSGTTSNPKGCPINHRSMLDNSRALAERYELTGVDKFWSPLPLCHIAGILPMLAIFAEGGSYQTMSYFDTTIALKMLANNKVTAAYPCFVTIISDLVNHPEFPNTDLSAIRVMNSNFAVQPKELAEKVAAVMPNAIQVGTFGMTETAGTVCTSRLSDPLETRLTKLGVPLSGWEVKIIDAETGQEAATGERGEIAVRGSSVCNCYYKDDEKTAESFKDGWFFTGDVGSLDEQGQIMFHGRLKDMLKVGGENVAAAEIEAHLQTHPAVKLAQVVGVPDARMGEVAAACLELHDDQSVSSDEIIEHCKGEIASFKIPRFVSVVTEWPMSTSKIQKFKLRDQVISEHNLS